jgi:hypothetical protein
MIIQATASQRILSLTNPTGGGGGGGGGANLQYDKFVDLVLDCANLWAGDGGDRSVKTQPPSVSTLLELLGVVLHKVSALPSAAVLGGTDVAALGAVWSGWSHRAKASCRCTGMRSWGTSELPARHLKERELGRDSGQYAVQRKNGVCVRITGVSRSSASEAHSHAFTWTHAAWRAMTVGGRQAIQGGHREAAFVGEPQPARAVRGPRGLSPHCPSAAPVAAGAAPPAAAAAAAAAAAVCITQARACAGGGGGGRAEAAGGERGGGGGGGRRRRARWYIRGTLRLLPLCVFASLTRSTVIAESQLHSHTDVDERWSCGMRVWLKQQWLESCFPRRCMFCSHERSDDGRTPGAARAACRPTTVGDNGTAVSSKFASPPPPLQTAKP